MVEEVGVGAVVGRYERHWCWWRSASFVAEPGVSRVTEPLVLGQGVGGAEGLAAARTLHLQTTTHVHPLVTAEVGELRVCLK